MRNYFQTNNNDDGGVGPPKRRDFLRSDEVSEIVSDRPDSIIRWGTAVFVIVLCLLISLSWLIKYPDIVRGRAKLTSINAPKAVVTQISSKLVILKAKENDIAKKGEVLGFLETTANSDHVITLLSSLNLMQASLDSNHLNLYIPFTPGRDLGELQMAYQEFHKTFLIYKSYLATGFYSKKKQMLFSDLNNLKKSHEILYEQKALREQDFKLALETFDVSKSLSEGNVISELDFRQEHSKMISKKLALPQIRLDIVRNEAEQSEKQKEILELENVINEQRFLFQQALNTLKSHINDWLMKYALISPIDGRVVFASLIQESQHLTAGQTVCFIYPNNTNYFVEMLVPQLNMGKVEVGQEVHLSFDSYPFQENGIVEGRIDFITEIPIDSSYIAKVSLVNGLETSYHKQIHYREGLVANAEIITSNLRLIERIYYALTGQIRKN